MAYLMDFEKHNIEDYYTCTAWCDIADGEEVKGTIHKFDDGYYRFLPDVISKALTCRDCKEISSKLAELNKGGD